VSTRLSPTGTGVATAPAASLKVGLGQLVVSADPSGVLAALGLGSCIGLVITDVAAGVAGMAHVMLPDSDIATRPGPEGKYADTAVPSLIDAVCSHGAQRRRLVCAMAGGAQMFGAGSGGGVLNIGQRNAVAVRAALESAGLRLRAAQTGGSSGRTLEVIVATGAISVRTVGGTPAPL
jgi:chemotaxis protein CheD